MTRQEKWDLDREKIESMMKEKGGIAKTADFYELGMDYRRIQAFVDAEVIERIKNGYYALDYKKQNEDEVVARLFSDGVLTMESAAYVYGYLKQKPYEYRVAIDKNTSKSRFLLKYPFVHPYYSEPEVLEMGVDQIAFGDAVIGIYNKERLICECLKYEERMDREDLKAILLGYIKESDKDMMKLLSYARARKVLKKVQDRIGVWL